MSDPNRTTIIDRAERALRAFGALDRDEASYLLLMWQHRGELSTDERAAVLDRFPAATPVTHPAWCAHQQEPRLCVELEEHHGVQVAINPSGDELVGIRIHLVQFVGYDQTHVSLIVSDDGTEHRYLITVAQLLMLSIVGRRLVP